MNKLKSIVLICILCSLTGCFLFDECHYYDATECGNSYEKLPAYANESGVRIKLVNIETYYSTYEKFIDHGDTLHSSYYFKESPEEWNIENTYDCGIVMGCDNPVRMELHFLDIPEKCLIFDGPIKHDGIDMRSWDSYKEGKKIPNWADFWAGVEYVYTITPEHRAMAKEENCEDF